MRKALWDEFENKSWSGKRGKAPRSGMGSSLGRTENLRNALPGIFERYEVGQFLDAPCGDWFWMQHVDLSRMCYVGADISQSLIANNVERFGAPNRRFLHLDITSDPLPQADLMMCRECLFHLKWYLRWDFLRNFANSKIPYLMTTICHVPKNRRVLRSGGYAPFNPMVAPFHLPAPLELIIEAKNAVPFGDNGEVADRSMGIWSRSQIEEAIRRHDAASSEKDMIASEIGRGGVIPAINSK